RPLRVADRRRLSVAALRLRRAARARARADRGGEAGRAAVHGAGGPRDRSAEQATRLRAAGAGARHGRGEPRAGLPGRLARLRDRLPDPRRARPHDDPPPDEQPAQDGGRGCVRAHGGRGGTDRGAAERREPALPPGETCEAGAPAPPSGSQVRARRRMSDYPDDTDDSQDWPLRDYSSRLRPPSRVEPEPEEDEAVALEAAPEPAAEPEPAPELEPEAAVEELDEQPEAAEPQPVEPEASVAVEEQHAEGGLRVPDGYQVLEGFPTGARRTVARAGGSAGVRTAAAAVPRGCEPVRAGTTRSVP